ncbi:MAG: sigma 54-interacting transcriptional regulator [Kofleriaceae bacterium]
MTSRVRVEIRTSGPSATHSITLGDTDAVVVGRAPDPHAVAGPAQLVTVASPNVSANHVAIRRNGDQISLVELGSRNGTWFRLPPASEVRFTVPSHDLALQIAPPFDQEVGADAPADAQWRDPSEYAASLQHAIAEWLEARKVTARTAIVAGSASRSNRPGRIAIATGEDLVVELLGTADSGWLQWLAMLERYVARHNVLFETEQSMREEGLIVASPAMRRAVARVIAAAASGARVLMLTGPSGSGKEGLARCFHRHTARAGSFVARNCAMFSKDLVRSELFGAERGAFTSSVQRIVGAVEVANEGTLFLDELGELPREVQPMLLRFLDHGEYERVGSPASQRADVRIVCATNRDLRLAALADEFRTDLWFRLSVHVVEVPPLYERQEDIVAILSRRGRGTASLFDAFEPAARELLSEHDWPGNFRELNGFAERLVLAVPHGPISVDQVRVALAEGSLEPLKPSTRASTGQLPEAVAAHAERAAAGYLEDHGSRPRTWDEVKDFVENYLKPVMFAELSSTAHLPSLAAVELREVADRMESDRGTAAKQLRRYFDRFG